MSKIYTVVIFIIAVISLSGCHSYRTVGVFPQGDVNEHYLLTEPALHAGDKIKYQVNNGTKNEMTVGSVTPQSIISDNGTEVMLAGITSLEKQEISEGKTAAAIGGGIAAVATVVVVIIVASLSHSVSKSLD